MQRSRTPTLLGACVLSLTWLFALIAKLRKHGSSVLPLDGTIVSGYTAIEACTSSFASAFYLPYSCSTIIINCQYPTVRFFCSAYHVCLVMQDKKRFQAQVPIQVAQSMP